MKPILIDVSKFGGEAVLPELQKLVDEAYRQGYQDGARKSHVSLQRGLQAPAINFNKDGMVIGDFDWIDDETQSI